MEEHKVSNIHQLRDVIMEEWKRTPVATCEALVNSMPKRVKAVLENNDGHTKYLHFGPNLDILDKKKKKKLFHFFKIFIFLFIFLSFPC